MHVYLVIMTFLPMNFIAELANSNVFTFPLYWQTATCQIKHKEAKEQITYDYSMFSNTSFFQSIYSLVISDSH